MVKRTTIKDVAALAKTSVTTVSLILNGKGDRFSTATINRVQQAQVELAYAPDYFAQNMVTRKTKTLGVLVPDINNPFFSQFIQGVEEVAYQSDFIPLIYNVGAKNHKADYYLEELVRRTVDGFILAVPNLTAETINRYLFQNQIPYTLLDQSQPAMNSDRISVLDLEGGQLATQYLIQHQHRRIGLILPQHPANNLRNRQKGYRMALVRAGIKADEQWIIHGELTKQGGYETAQAVIDSGVSAVFAINDEMAIGLYRGLKDRGYRIPEDISVLGYDNIAWCDYVTPRLTTIEQPIFKLGQEATRLLLRRIESPELAPQTVRLATRLVERDSVQNNEEAE